MVTARSAVAGRIPGFAAVRRGDATSGCSARWIGQRSRKRGSPANRRGV